MPSILHSRRGQAVLSLVFIIGAMVVLVGLALAFLATSFVNSAYAFQASQRAGAIAVSGANDALARLNRKNTLVLSSLGVPVGSNLATVSVVQNSPTTGEATITSVATVANRQRSLRVVVSVASSTGQVSVLSWKVQ